MKHSQNAGPPPWSKPSRPELNPYIQKLDEIPEWVTSFEAALSMSGCWQSRFETEQPLYLDIGCGYSQFLAQLAPNFPERNFLGLELKYKRLYKSVQRTKKEGISNIRFLRLDARMLERAFAPRELSGVYVNYPDPWPRSRDFDKRMVSPGLVSQLEKLLSPGGQVLLKSDWEPNRGLFREAFEGSSFEMTDYIPELASWNRNEDNVPTSYERRFQREGKPCFFYEFTLRAS